MKKLFAALAAVFLLTVALSAAACSSGGENRTLFERLADEGVEVSAVPTVFYDGAQSPLTDASIRTDTLELTAASGVSVSVALTDGAEAAELSAPETAAAEGGTSYVYTVTAKAVGEYTLSFTVGGADEAEELDLQVRPAYPENPEFDPLTGYGQNNPGTTTANVHDPVILETDDGYYTFSTDNMGPDFGYQIRKSSDLVHWEYVGAAIENCGGPTDAQSVYERGRGGLQDVYDLLSEDENWNDSCWTLWAPDVIAGADGKYWLYGCWTAAVGQGHSAIFLCKADDVEGPYKPEEILVYSYDGWVNGPNAIDPSLYYDAEGNLYMAYGSFTGGVYVLQLDPETGLRRKDDPYYGADWAKVREAGEGPATAAARYGTRLVSTNDMEGPVVSYHENVAVYGGEVGEYADSALTYENRYYLMGSAGSLSSTYNMRSYHSAQPTSGYTAHSASRGDRVSGSFSWRENANDTAVSFDYAYPGHNDMITTTEGVNLLAYHDRITFASGNLNHYLMLSQYAFNSRGDLVMSPNRYAGEALRKVTAAEISGLSEGRYAFAYVSGNSYSGSFNGGYAAEGLTLSADGSLSYGGAAVGTWLLYGENWVYLNIQTPIAAATGSVTLSGEFYGVAFPAYIEREGRGGLSLSLLSDDGLSTLYLNMQF